MVAVGSDGKVMAFLANTHHCNSMWLFLAYLLYDEHTIRVLTLALQKKVILCPIFKIDFVTSIMMIMWKNTVFTISFFFFENLYCEQISSKSLILFYIAFCCTSRTKPPFNALKSHLSLLQIPTQPSASGLPDPSWFYRSLSAGPSASRRSLNQYWKWVQIRDETINFHFHDRHREIDRQASSEWVSERGVQKVHTLMYWGSQTNSVLKFQILSNINIYWKNSSLRYGI